jgi:hypothetical protein
MSRLGYALLLLVPALMVGYLLWQVEPSRMARIGRNAWVGVRTGATMQSDAAWVAAHEAAWPMARLGARLSLAWMLSPLLAVPLVPRESVEPVVATATIGGMTLLFVFLMIAAVRAQRAAQDVNRRQGR